MIRKTNESGSALLAAVIVVMIVVGIGGAFLAETAFRHKSITIQIEKDEASMLAESALEKTRRCLWVYRAQGVYTWDDLLTFCNSLQMDPTNDEVFDKLKTIYTQVEANSGYFKDYFYRQDEPGIATANDAPIPGDPDCFYGQTQPYGPGGFHVIVKDNDDGDGDPLRDNDLRLYAVITTFLPDGSFRQIEALLEFQNPFFNPDSAIMVEGSILLAGSPTVKGLKGKVHTNADMFINGSVGIAVSGDAVGQITIEGNPPAPAEGWNPGSPNVPLPDIVPQQYLKYADFILTSTGQITSQSGVVVGAPGAGQFAGVTFGAGEWIISSNKDVAEGTYYIQGDISLTGQGNTPQRTISLIAEGSISARGNSKLLPALLNDPNDVKKGGVLFMAGGDISLAGNAGCSLGLDQGNKYPDAGGVIPVVIAAHEQINMRGTADIFGVVMAKDAEDLHDTVTTNSGVGDVSGEVGGNANVHYDGGMETIIENPNNSVLIRNVRKLR